MKKINCCLKCCGLMVAERMTGGYVNDAYGFWQWRCLNCGLVVDLTILRRKAKISGNSSQPSGELLLSR